MTWTATGERWGFEILTDGTVRTLEDGEWVEADADESARLIDAARFALGDSIADIAGIPESE